MDKEVVDYYSAIKRHVLESVLMRWMKLEPTIPSEVSLKEKHQYCSLMHIYGIYKDDNDERHRCKEQSFCLCRRRRGWDDLRE